MPASSRLLAPAALAALLALAACSGAEPGPTAPGPTASATSATPAPPPSVEAPRTDAPQVTLTDAAVWTVPDKVVGFALVGDAAVFRNQGLRAVDLTTGQEVWSWTAGEPIPGTEGLVDTLSGPYPLPDGSGFLISYATTACGGECPEGRAEEQGLALISLKDGKVERTIPYLAAVTGDKDEAAYTREKVIYGVAVGPKTVAVTVGQNYDAVSRPPSGRSALDTVGFDLATGTQAWVTPSFALAPRLRSAPAGLAWGEQGEIAAGVAASLDLGSGVITWTGTTPVEFGGEDGVVVESGGNWSIHGADSTDTPLATEPVCTMSGPLSCTVPDAAGSAWSTPAGPGAVSPAVVSMTVAFGDYAWPELADGTRAFDRTGQPRSDAAIPGTVAAANERWLLVYQNDGAITVWGYRPAG